MKLRAVIVDDERIARSRLRRLLSKEPEVEVVAECADGESTIAACRDERPDILLLDIQLPGMDGFAILDALGSDAPPAVIFVTAFDEHAVRAFEACALDYLLKPTTSARLAKALGRVRERLPVKRIPPVAPAPAVQHFTVRSSGRIHVVAVDEIDWIEAAGNYAILHARGHNHMLRETMSALEARLPASFLRLSRSAIVDLRRVKELQAGASGEHCAVLHDGHRVPFTRSVREVEARLRSV